MLFAKRHLKFKRIALIGLVGALGIALPLAAQQAGPPAGGGRGGAPAGPPPDPAMVARGLALYDAQCASCHGADLAGGTNVSINQDLLRSPILALDLARTAPEPAGAVFKGYMRGTDIAKYMSVGVLSAERHPTAIALSDDQLSDLYVYLKAAGGGAGRGGEPVPSILVGNVAAGRTYFNGKGGCSTCHSVTSGQASAAVNLAGIATRVSDPKALQMRIVNPPRDPNAPAAGGGGRGAPPPPVSTGPVTILKDAIKATVKQKGKPDITGQLVRLNEFEVTIADLSTGQRQTFARTLSGQPAVVLTDPLEPHWKMRAGLRSYDMHDLTAYLNSLK